MKEKTILIKLANHIKQLRKVKNLTQEQLAEKANLHFTYIGEIERVEKNPTVTTLEKIAKAFGISLPELLTFPDDKRIKSAGPTMLDNITELLNKALDIVEGHKTKRGKS